MRFFDSVNLRHVSSSVQRDSVGPDVDLGFHTLEKACIDGIILATTLGAIVAELRESPKAGIPDSILQICYVDS